MPRLPGLRLAQSPLRLGLASSTGRASAPFPFGDRPMESKELGSAIRAFRLCRRQVHNGQPWTIEDLAVAMGADKAHLSRIERGLIVPNRATLLRMARALDLSWSE